MNGAMAELSKRVRPKTNPPVPAGRLRVFVQKQVRIKLEGPSPSIPGARRRLSPSSLLYAGLSQ